MRTRHEIDHGQLLSGLDPEFIWGWDTPAGRLRAERRFHLLAHGARLGVGKRVLEIGCGTGLFTEKFCRTGAQIVAVDLSSHLLEKARGRDLPRDRVRFLETPFEELDNHEPFDAVIGSSVLHHLDVEPALNKIYLLLKPGGVMSFAEPNMLNPQVFAERTFAFLPFFWYVSPDETAFVRHRLRILLKRIGFKGIEITPFDWLHPFTPRPFINAVSRIGRILEKIPFLREFSGSLYIRCYRP